LKFREFEDEVKRELELALQELNYPSLDLEVETPSDSSFGELSSAIALKLSRQLKKPPSIIAEDILRLILKRRNKHLIASVEAHKSGYLNFKVNWSRFNFETLQEISEEEMLSKPEVASRKVVTIEHTNVNPNKALHIGHARNLVLGDALARIMDQLGHSVQVLNYIDDSGAQVADVIVGFKFLGFIDEAPLGTKFDAYCGDFIYTKVNQEYERNTSLKEKQRFVLQEIEKGGGEISEYTRKIVKKILADQLKTCWRLGARYDLLNWESHILRTGIWENVFNEMKRKGIARLEREGENKGCWVLSDKEVGDEKVLVRSDGTVVYVAKDIPYAAWKIGLVKDPFQYDIYNDQPDKTLWTTTIEQGRKKHPKFGFSDLAITVIDVRQKNLQRIVGRVLERLAGESKSKRYIHRGYEVVALSKKSAESLGIKTDKEFVHMTGRKGIYINADKVLDALKKRAAEETKKRNPELSSEEIDLIAERVALAAFRFELLKQDPDKMMIFDIEESLKLEGDTGPYMLYSYARARRIIEKSGDKPRVEEGAAMLIDPKEKELIKHLSMFDEFVIEAGEFLSPKEIARYAYKISSLFNEFYESVPVNTEERESVRIARLALVDAFTKVVKESLGLLGITCLERI
jgi:arginyl-tRNA synthetase